VEKRPLFGDRHDGKSAWKRFRAKRRAFERVNGDIDCRTPSANLLPNIKY
jgi:hypothetical protein